MCLECECGDDALWERLKSIEIRKRRQSKEEMTESDWEEIDQLSNIMICTRCHKKAYVYWTFHCPICKGRHSVFAGYLGEYSTFFCPSKPIVPMKNPEETNGFPQLEIKYL